jgi:arsenate reductase (thioredoxin)
MNLRVLILCTGNSARSQMAEAILRSLDPELEVHSAGTRPADRVHPGAVAAMAELGVDLSGARPKSVDQYLHQPFDWVITVCDHARESCPHFGGTVRRRLHAGFDDPAAVAGPDAEVLGAFRRVRDEIRDKFAELFPAIRPAGPEDYEAAVSLLSRSGLDEPGLPEQFGTGYAIALTRSEMVGLAGIERHGTLGLLRSVAVEPSKRGLGIAERLVGNRLESARSEGLNAVYLLTTGAAGYFERLGFARVDREAAPDQIRATHQFTVACPASSTLMVRTLA